MPNGKQNTNVAVRPRQVARSITASDGPALQVSSVADMTLHARAGFRWATLLLTCLALPSAGCSPRLDPETYGEVVHTLPEVPGAEEPFPLPELTQGEPPETAPK